MAADSRGRDINETLIYTTGHGAFAPVASANVIPKAELGSETLEVPEAYKYMGLRTSDGGPEFSTEAGDAIEFLEDGFTINGDGSISVAMTLAQFNPAVRALIRDAEPDANGVIEVKKTTPDTQYILLLESIYKSGLIKREHGVARISEVSLGKDERNTVNGVTVTFQWVRHELFNRSYYWEAVVDAPTGTVVS